MRKTLRHFLKIFLVTCLFFPSARVFAQAPASPITTQESKSLIKSEKVHADTSRKDFVVEKYKTTVYEERVTKEIKRKEISKEENLYSEHPVVNKAVYTSQYETTVITPKRVAAKDGHVAENVFVMTKEDIARLPAHDLSEVLAYMPGVDVQLNGQYGQSTALSINGSYSRQVLLMIDGVPMNTQLSGQANPSQIPLEMIQRIELIKGASSSSWGSGLGGVINVITYQPQDTKKIQGQWSGLVGARRTTKNSAEVSGRVDRWGYFMSGNYFDTDGISSQTDATTKNLFQKLTYSVNDQTQLLASFGYNGGDVSFGVTPSNTTTKQPYVTRYGQLAADIADEDKQYHVGYKYNDQSFTSDILNGSTQAPIFSTINANVYHGLSFNHSLTMREEDV
ncbi:MAG: TonB-dependent receptor, partial [Candidatus Omnitrophica bacterium]|nr:TonB-dependent receptor [Candidatus Omnitrophota bacterium]